MQTEMQRINNDTTGETEITVIATGFGDKNQQSELPEFKDNSANIRAFTEPVKPEEAPQPEQQEEHPVQPADEVEDISIKAKTPFLTDDDLPPFLRKLKK